jgi:integrase
MKRRAEMAVTRKATSEKGVYEVPSEKKMIKNSRGKIVPDVCYYINFKIKVDGSDGEKKQKLIWEKVGWASEGYSPQLASVVRSERLRTLRHGEELPSQKKKAPTFKDVMKKYLEWCDTNKRNGRTTDSYLYKHLTQFDNKRLDEIHPFALEGLKQEILKVKKLTPATAKHVLVLIGEAYNKAIAWGLYKGENPVKKVKMPVLENKRERFLSYDEANKLLNALKTKSPQLHDICLLSLYCGLRMGEILNLRGQDLDFENGLIHVADPKNKHPRKAYMTTTVKEMLKSREPESPGELVFKSRKGEKIDSVSRTFERTVEDLGFNKGIKDPRQKIVAHSLRHTFASWLALQGEPIQVIAELLGHRTLAMTMRYSHLTQDHRKAAIGRLEESMANGAKERAEQ